MAQSTATQSNMFRTIQQITRHAIVDLDPLLASCDPRSTDPGRDIFPHSEPAYLPPRPFTVANTVVIGKRIETPLADPADTAMRLAWLASEKDVTVILLSHLDYSGLERFGFRTERISGSTPQERAACEAEARAFWAIEVVL